MVTFRPPYNKLEGVLKRDTLLEHTSQGISVKIIPPILWKYFPTPYRRLEVSII